MGPFGASSQNQIHVGMNLPDDVAWGTEGLLHNVKDGYLEAIVRGNRASLLSQQDYANLTQCETLDDVKLHLVSFSGHVIERCAQHLCRVSNLSYL